MARGVLSTGGSSTSAGGRSPGGVGFAGTAWWPGLLMGAVGLLTAGVLAVRPVSSNAAPVTKLIFADLFLPLVLDGADVAELPPPVAVTFTPTASPTATVTSTPAPTATKTPIPSPTPTQGPTGRIHGRLTRNGQPLAPGFGVPPFPQIELHRRVSGEWEKVASAVTVEGGLFEFVNPPALGPGEVYRVVWRNDIDVGLGSDLWLHRWWSRNLTTFGHGEDIDVGTFEVADLTYVFPCHDCHRTLPITYKWNPRPNPGEVYRWSLFKKCGHLEDRFNAYRTQSLGHASQYTLNQPPPGFTYDTVYCWYVFIEDGANGTGWPFYAWRTAFLSGQGLARYGLRLELAELGLTWAGSDPVARVQTLPVQPARGAAVAETQGTYLAEP